MAAQRVDYITRQGTYSAAEARVRHQGLQHGTDIEREDLVYWKARNLPEWAGENATVFFAAAERHTSAHYTAYEEWKFSLPRELDRPQQMAAASAFLCAAFGETHPYVWAFHCPRAADGGDQPHVHVLWSPRTLDGIARSPEQFFRRYDPARPARGGARMDPALGHFGAVKAARILYTDMMNVHLEEAGQTARLHPARLSDRGIDRPPEPRLTIAESNDYKFHGKVSTRMQHVLDHRQARQQHIPKERNNARAYWEGRKAALGITRDMPIREKLQGIQRARQQKVRQAPVRASLDELRERERTVGQQVRGLEGHLLDVQRMRRREEAVERRQAPRTWQGALAAERVLAAGTAHGLPPDRQAEQMVVQLVRLLAEEDSEGAGSALHIRLFDEDEPHRSQGHSW